MLFILLGMWVFEREKKKEGVGEADLWAEGVFTGLQLCTEDRL